MESVKHIKMSLFTPLCIVPESIYKEDLNPTLLGLDLIDPRSNFFCKVRIPLE